MNITKHDWLSFLLKVVFIFLIVSSYLYWGETKNQNMSITVTVDPVRTIVVDRNLQIETVFSNTKSDVRPQVVLDTQDGPNLPYTEAIQKQYFSLKGTINFEKPGIVYQRDNRIIVSVFKRILSLVEKITHISF